LKRGSAALCSLLLLGGCGPREDQPRPAKSSLARDVVAQVGREPVSESTVTGIARTRELPPREAAVRAVEDALWATGARDMLARPTVGGIERAALARSLIATLRTKAEALGPPTQAELDAIVKERWVEIDRPDAARTTHAVVVNQDPGRDVAARTLAEKLAASLQDVTSGSELISRIRQFSNEGFDVRGENLPFVTQDGRTFERRGERFVDAHQDFDLAFARAANELERPGQLSSVVKSKYGYHVIRLEERAPGSVVPKAELPTLLGPEVFAARAKRARADLLEPLRQAGNVQILRAADELTSKVAVR